MTQRATPPPPGTFGIGVVFTEADGGDKVVHFVAPDGPAGKVGISRGDRIAAIDDRPSAALTIEEAAHLVKGPASSVVHLALRRANGVVNVTVPRGPADSLAETRMDETQRVLAKMALTHRANTAAIAAADRPPPTSPPQSLGQGYRNAHVGQVS